ncbi:MAG: hypothetical protein WBW84_00015 [Acidobacteriaceae bacterium]
MRRVTESGARRRGGGAQVVVRDKTGSRATRRTAGAPDLALLGQGCGESLPSPRRIPASYSLETNGERLCRLCAALVERNLADAKLWQESGGVAVVFARSAIQRLIEEFCGALETRSSIAAKSGTTWGPDIAGTARSTTANSWPRSRSRPAAI